MRPAKVISGGQTGADQAGLYAAEEVGIATGGLMPSDYRTATGPRPDLARRFNLSCTKAWNYAVRTKLNVLQSDATLIFGNSSSPGSKLTIKLCLENNKKFLAIPWGLDSIEAAELIRKFLTENEPKILNIAGNREETKPGIFKWTKQCLVQALSGVE